MADRNNNKKQFSLPGYLFLNCYGTYLNGIFNYYADSESYNDIVLFLASYYLKYTSLENTDIQKKFESSNPWHYQPLNLNPIQKSDIIGNPLDDILFFIDEIQLFFTTNFNILVHNFTDNKEDIILMIRKYLNQGCMVLVEIDEFFNPHNKLFYKKEHNKHGVMIREYDDSSHTFKILDSNNSANYTFSYNEMENAYHSEYGNHYMFCIECMNFQNRLNYSDIIYKYLTSFNFDIVSWDMLLNELHDLTPNMDIFLYNLEGINCSLISKVLPIFQMHKHIGLRAKSHWSMDLSRHFSSIDKIAGELRMLTIMIADLIHRKNKSAYSGILYRTSRIIQEYKLSVQTLESLISDSLLTKGH